MPFDARATVRPVDAASLPRPPAPEPAAGRSLLDRVVGKLRPSVEPPADFGCAAAGLPPIPERRHEVFRFYRLEIAPDATVGKRMPDGRFVPHPIYAPYVIDAYALAHARSREPVHAEGAARVADRAAAFMEPVGDGDGVAWHFDPRDGLTQFPHRFYSGLVQVRYLRSLTSVAQASGRDDLAALARRVFRSLRVPVEDGGVLLRTPFGPLVEEYPHAIPTYVLNGWSTVITELLRYARRAGHDEARAFAEENLAAMRALLPRYDLPRLANTRYQLTGFAYLRLVARHPRTLALRGFETRVGGRWHGLGPEAAGRWTNHLRAKEVGADGFASHRTLMLNGVWSLIEDRQAARLHLECRRPTQLAVSLAQGEYDPLLTSMPTKAWADLVTVDLPEGGSVVELDFDNAAIDRVVYPTNFRKEVGGEMFNAYHYIHAQNLEELLETRDDPVLRTYAERWRGYTREWPGMEILSDPRISHRSLRETHLK